MIWRVELAQVTLQPESKTQSIAARAIRSRFVHPARENRVVTACTRLTGGHQQASLNEPHTGDLGISIQGSEFQVPKQGKRIGLAITERVR